MEASAASDPRRMREILSGVVRRVCPAWMAAEREDLVQNACLRIVQRLGQEKESPHMGASYLWRVAHSVVMDEIRRRRRHPESPLVTEALDEPAGDLASPERGRESAAMQAAITAGLRTLRESQRRAVVLYLYGFGLKESATMLGWNAKRVDNQRYHGLAALRAYLQERCLQP
jgi:RNA polymerase sigma-70 factor (ECF subfamily)